MWGAFLEGNITHIEAFFRIKQTFRSSKMKKYEFTGKTIDFDGTTLNQMSSRCNLK